MPLLCIIINIFNISFEICKRFPTVVYTYMYQKLDVTYSHPLSNMIPGKTKRVAINGTVAIQHGIPRF